MKKTGIITIILFALLYTTIVVKAQKRNDIVDMELKGKIKTLHMKVYRSKKKDGKIKLIGLSVEQMLHFDEAGFLIETKRKFKGYGGNGKWKVKKYQYNAKKQCIGYQRYNGEQLTQTCAYTLKKGRIITEKYQDTKGTLLGTTQHKYNKKGLVLETQMIKGSGKVVRRYVYKYDRKKRLIFEQSWKEEQLQGSSEIKYLKNNVQEKKRFDKEGKLKRLTKSILNDQGKTLEEKTYNLQNILTKKAISQFDEKGNQILRQVFNGDGSEQKYNYMRYEHKYDKTGNWVRQIEFLRNGNSLDVTFRKIEYYD